MEGLAASKWAIDLLLSGFGLWRSSRDPIHRQAQRLLDSFEAHGIRRQQIARLLPSDLDVPVQAFSTAKALSQYMSLRLLDWTASTLAVQRDWLDLVSDDPHEVVQIYKSPNRFMAWIEQQDKAVEGRFSSIRVVSEAQWRDPGEAKGRFFVVHEECFAELNNVALSRYRFLSNGWNFDHSPCLINLLAIIMIAESFGIPTFGQVGTRQIVRKAEEGTLLLPQGLATCNRRWDVQGWVPVRYRLENCVSAVHRQRWQETLDLLERNGLEKLQAAFIR